MKSLFQRLRSTTMGQPRLSPANRDTLLGTLPFLARLDAARLDRLCDLVARYQAGKTITPLHGLAV